MDAVRNNEAKWLLRAQRVVLPDGIAPACLHIQDGVVGKIAEWDDIDPAARLFDAGDQAILPGAVDVHTHINEPGRTHWEGFESATHAAAAGGITTLVDMPLNSIPPTTSVDALDRKVESATGKSGSTSAFMAVLSPATRPICGGWFVAAWWVLNVSCAIPASMSFLQ
jgi:allantoinase